MHQCSTKVLSLLCLVTLLPSFAEEPIYHIFGQNGQMTFDARMPRSWQSKTIRPKTVTLPGGGISTPWSPTMKFTSAVNQQGTESGQSS